MEKTTHQNDINLSFKNFLAFTGMQSPYNSAFLVMVIEINEINPYPTGNLTNTFILLKSY